MSPFARTMLLMAALGCAVSASAGDRRIRTIEYSDSKVVQLNGCQNFQTMVRFGKGEKIENVGLGDATEWQVTPNRRADLLFVKPLQRDALTNMTVVTNRHTYNFELKTKNPVACSRGDVVYDMRFQYPEEPKKPDAGTEAGKAPKPQLPEKRNTSYTYSGEIDLIPIRVFDDGKSTYFKWAKGVPVPAIYAITGEKSETIVNFISRDDYIVVDQLARAFRLRRGKKHMATLYNDAYAVPKLDALSPKPKKTDDEGGIWPF